MESIILEILERLRAGEQLGEKDLLRILNDHNRQLTSNSKHYSKKKLLPFYLRTKQREPERWAAWAIEPDLEQQLIALLQVKPRRSASGVATITVITKPWKCAGNCIYCPNDLRMPKSYLSDEPACQRAERNYFDPYLQVTSRLRALDQMGHATSKIELIILGGSWSDYPRNYQLWFTTELFRALNDADLPAASLFDFEVASSENSEGGEAAPHQGSHEAGSSEKASTSQNMFGTLADVNARERRSWYKECGLTFERDELAAFTDDVQSQVDAGNLSYNAGFITLYDANPAWQAVSAAQHATLADLEREHARNEHALHRVVGFVVETRPAVITPEALTFIRQLGATKIQMGIQSLDQRVHDLNHRPVTVSQIERALDLARLFGFKNHTHFMVNLLGQTPESDKADFARFVHERPFQPDEIKLYPCALVYGTELVDYYETGEWQPYDEATLIDVLTADVLATPPFTRISRMIRDFSAHDIVAGNKKVNLRQLVESHAEQLVTSTSIQEIRHREISTAEIDPDQLTLDIVSYETTSTHEQFLQWVTPENKIAGFLRLSLPKPEAFTTYANELPIGPGEAMIREVHIYGRAATLHQQGTAAQHRGLGKQLIKRACAIARDAGYEKINVISAIGTREYYRRLGFTDSSLYLQHSL